MSYDKSKLGEADILFALKKKKESNSKALKIVEEFLESCITVNDFLEKLQYISQSHYDDVVEERFLLGLCGYPICCNPLTNVPKKIYQISMKNKKVYDITERKKFCCTVCFKASEYIKSQIPASPLWLRSNDTPKFKLL